MENMVNVYFFGKKYQVPASLTIMKALEYAGYSLVRGCGCRNGFCGACATLYRIKGKTELKTCLACQQQVEEGMYVATLPFFPLVKQVYDIEKIKPTEQIMMQLYPEIYSCIGCNACCVMCGICSSRCPAGVSHPQVAILARRLYGKYIAPECKHLIERVAEINDGKFADAMKDIMTKPLEEQKTLYNSREIEK